MKKLITIAAATAVLGAGVYAEPAYADADIQRFNHLANQVNAMNGWSKEYCLVSQEAAELLTGVSAKGRWLRFGKNDGGAQHHEYQVAFQNDVRSCQAKGLLPRPRTAPVAQQRPAVRSSGNPYMDVVNGIFQGMDPQTRALLFPNGGFDQGGVVGAVKAQSRAVMQYCGAPNDSQAWRNCEKRVMTYGF